MAPSREAAAAVAARPRRRAAGGRVARRGGYGRDGAAACRTTRRPRTRRPSDEDPFAGWPQPESGAVIEDAPVEGESVEHVEGEIDVPDGYTVLEGMPLGRRRSVAVVVSRFNGGLTNRMLAKALDALEEAEVVVRRDHGRAGSRRVRAAARGDGAREDAALRVRGRARRDRARRDAALRLRRERGRVGPAAGGDRDGRAGRVRRAHGRDGRAGRGAHRPRRATRCGPRSRWPTCSRGCAPARTERRRERRSRRYHGRPCPRSAQSVARSPGSETTARTRWSRPSGGSTRTCSASACS